MLPHEFQSKQHISRQSVVYVSRTAVPTCLDGENISLTPTFKLRFEEGFKNTCKQGHVSFVFLGIILGRSVVLAHINKLILQIIIQTGTHTYTIICIYRGMDFDQWASLWHHQAPWAGGARPLPGQYVLQSTSGCHWHHTLEHDPEPRSPAHSQGTVVELYDICVCTCIVIIYFLYRL